MKHIPWLFCLFVLSPFTGLHAQSQNQNTQKLVKTRLVNLGTQGPIHDVGLWKDGKFEELRIPSSHFPEPVEYVGPNPITMVSMVKNEEGIEVPITVAQVQIPEESEEVLLLMLPLPPTQKIAQDAEAQPEDILEAPITYRIKVIDFSPAVFPDESFLVWNLTGRPLVGTLGNVSFRAEPNQFSLLQPDIDGKPKALDAKIMYADDSSKASYTSRKWFLQPQQKFMVIMTGNPEDPNHYMLKTIRY